MEAKELMIRDWITFNGEPAQVIIIDYWEDEISYFDDVAEEVLTVRNKDVKPIPLTEELLLKNGFYVYSKNDYSEAKLDVKINNLEYQICGTRKADKWHISIYKIKWEDRTKGKYNSCCLFSSGLFGEYDQIYVHDMQHYLRVSKLNDLADNFKIK